MRSWQRTLPNWRDRDRGLRILESELKRLKRKKYKARAMADKIRAAKEDLRMVFQGPADLPMTVVGAVPDEYSPQYVNVFDPRSKSTPYRCPVCEGRGIVPLFFYNLTGTAGTTAENQQCRTCGGRGILWG